MLPELKAPLTQETSQPPHYSRLKDPGKHGQKRLNLVSLLEACGLRLDFLFGFDLYLSSPGHLNY